MLTIFTSVLLCGYDFVYTLNSFFLQTAVTQLMSTTVVLRVRTHAGGIYTTFLTIFAFTYTQCWEGYF